MVTNELHGANLYKISDCMFNIAQIFSIDYNYHADFVYELGKCYYLVYVNKPDYQFHITIDEEVLRTQPKDMLFRMLCKLIYDKLLEFQIKKLD